MLAATIFGARKNNRVKTVSANNKLRAGDREMEITANGGVIELYMASFSEKVSLFLLLAAFNLIIIL
jgi:hypothetical protein